jgi:hypothetical protein
VVDGYSEPKTPLTDVKLESDDSGLDNTNCWIELVDYKIDSKSLYPL